MTNKTKRSRQWINQRIVQTTKQEHIGVHLIVEFWDGKIIDSAREIRKILKQAVKEAKANFLEISIHKFLPQGLTGVVLLSESHIAIHTWPEINYVAIDIFTCGSQAMPDRAINYLKKVFCPKSFKIKKINRGKNI